MTREFVDEYQCLIMFFTVGVLRKTIVVRYCYSCGYRLSVMGSCCRRGSMHREFWRSKWLHSGGLQQRRGAIRREVGARMSISVSEWPGLCTLCLYNRHAAHRRRQPCLLSVQLEACNVHRAPWRRHLLPAQVPASRHLRSNDHDK